MFMTGHVISLGGGKQSSAMALMAGAGKITPMPIGAVFADTKQETASTYKWLDYLESKLPFPIHRVSLGDLREALLNVRTSKGGNKYTNCGIPAYVDNGNLKTGQMQRQCTENYKIEVIQRFYRTHFQIHPSTKNLRLIQWIGISIDEVSRMKPARKPWLQNRFPLVELEMNRADCSGWLKRHGHPEPPRSACKFCPYKNDVEWLEMKTNEPNEFAEAAEFERLYQISIGETGRDMVPFIAQEPRPFGSNRFLQIGGRKGRYDAMAKSL